MELLLFERIITVAELVYSALIMETFLERLIKLESEVESLCNEQREFLIYQKEKETLQDLRYKNWIL